MTAKPIILFDGATRVEQLDRVRCTCCGILGPAKRFTPRGFIDRCLDPAESYTLCPDCDREATGDS